jgi:hypothetical protein
MPSDVVIDLEQRFLERLNTAAAELQRQLPHVTAHVWSSPTGSKTEYQGHDVGIDCLLKDIPAERPDNIALIIGVRHLTTTPELCDAEVCWGHPCGTVEASLIEEVVPYSEENIIRIQEGLPKLLAALAQALRKGMPSNWTEA